MFPYRTAQGQTESACGLGRRQRNMTVSGAMESEVSRRKRLFYLSRVAPTRLPRRTSIAASPHQDVRLLRVIHD